MKKRLVIPEKMDDPKLSAESHLHALRGLQRINRWTRNARIAWNPIWALAKTLSQDRLTVLDVATGAGDLPLAIAGYAAAAGVQLDLEACDISPRAISLARQNMAGKDVNIRFFELNVLTEDFQHDYDVVMCATFLHHLSETEAVSVLRKMRQAARHRIVVVDLVRSRRNWWQVWLAAHALSRSQVVHFDGPQSIRAAFTISEIRMLAAQAELRDVQVCKAWPCRFVLVGARR